MMCEINLKIKNGITFKDYEKEKFLIVALPIKEAKTQQEIDQIWDNIKKNANAE